MYNADDNGPKTRKHIHMVFLVQAGAFLCRGRCSSATRSLASNLTVIKMSRSQMRLKSFLGDKKSPWD